MGGIWAIVLAAGESKRMGFPKMLLNFDGITMIEKVLKSVTGSDLDSTLVVLGAEKERIMDIISRLPVKYCYNADYKEGMLSSVKAGFRNLPSDIEAALVFQGDQPFISTALINTVIDAYRSSGKGIVIPVHRNKRGHPLLVDKKYKDEIEKLDNSVGLRSLSLRFSYDVLEVDTDQAGILRDFDTYEDYIMEINQIK
jgi:molybdenum cofactor cytidylyltransferase